MRLVEVRLVRRAGAARTCFQPINELAWQSRGLGEEVGVGERGRGEKSKREALHYHCTCSVKLHRRGCGAFGVCVYVKMRRGGGWMHGLGGYLAPFLPVHPQGITHCLYCIFAPHDLQIFFFLPWFLNIPPPPRLSPSSNCERRSCQTGKTK